MAEVLATVEPGIRRLLDWGGLPARLDGETIQVFIDNTRIADYPKAVPADLLFNAMSFRVLGGSHGENDKFYISNIKINKE